MAEDPRSANGASGRGASAVTPRRPVSENYVVVESLERMPSLVARGLFYVTLLLVLAATAYVCLARIDVVATCRAVARPASHKTRILCDRSGFLTRIFISEGQPIEKGAPLFLVRSKETVTYLAKAEELRRTIPMRAEYYDTKVSMAKGQIEHCDSEHKSAVSIIRLKLEQSDLSIASTESDQAYWSKELARFTREYESLKKLLASGAASQREVDSAKSEADRARAENEKLAAKRSIALREKGILQQDLAAETSRYQEKRDSLAKELRNLELEKRTALQSMTAELERYEKMLSIKDASATAPAEGGEDAGIIRAGGAGTVSELYFRNPGEYVKESDLLCTIIPAGSPLYMDIVVANKDIGFIQKGMDIRFKLDAFPYTDYGTLRGEVAAIPPSAVEDSQVGFVYHVRGTLQQTCFRIKGREYPVKAGMTATAELITEKQTILSSLFRRR